MFYYIISIICQKIGDLFCLDNISGLSHSVNKMVQNCTFELNLFSFTMGNFFGYLFYTFELEKKKTFSWNSCPRPSYKLVPQFKAHPHSCQYPLINHLDLCTRFYHSNTRGKFIIISGHITRNSKKKKRKSSLMLGHSARTD